MNKLLTALIVIVTTAHIQAGWFTSDQEEVTKQMTSLVNTSRQALIEKWHLLAASKKVEIHEVVMLNRNGAPTKSAKEMTGCVIRCTIRWEGPINKDGYTKLILFYDNEVQRFTASRVISTNGVLNSDAADGAKAILDTFLNN